MFIAQELRKKSIAEYLLYMWQIEDLIVPTAVRCRALRPNISVSSTTLTSRKKT